MNSIRSKIEAFLKNRRNLRRMGMTAFGVLLSALSVGLFNNSMFGADPFQCFVNGLDRVVPMSFGTLYIVISVVMLRRYFSWIGTLSVWARLSTFSSLVMWPSFPPG